MLVRGATDMSVFPQNVSNPRPTTIRMHSPIFRYLSRIISDLVSPLPLARVIFTQNYSIQLLQLTLR